MKKKTLSLFYLMDTKVTHTFHQILSLKLFSLKLILSYHLHKLYLGVLECIRLMWTGSLLSAKLPDLLYDCALSGGEYIGVGKSARFGGHNGLRVSYSIHLAPGRGL